LSINFKILKGEKMYPRKAQILYLPVLCCIALALMFFQAPAKCYGFDINIDVSPNVLNIQSESSIVTVHTDIPYEQVEGFTVLLNNVGIDWWKMDDRGYFVAKFNSDDIKELDGLVIGDYNTLVLIGYTTDGEEFIGKQDIKVINNIPVGIGGK
jgi:hypothetical protein